MLEPAHLVGTPRFVVRSRHGVRNAGQHLTNLAKSGKEVDVTLREASVGLRLASEWGRIPPTASRRDDDAPKMAFEQRKR